MKRLFFLAAATLTGSICQAQLPDTATVSQGNDAQLRDRVLSEIQVTFNRRTRSIDSTVLKLDERVGDLDKSIKESRDAKDKADKLLIRLQALEDKQKAIDQNEMNIFQANYQSALVNLISMDREIKPLLLFNSTQAFFGGLAETGNPMNYAGFQDWYKGFNTYLQSNKEKSPMLSITSSLLNVTGSLTSAVPLAGPVTGALFSSMTNYIDNMGKKEKDLKAQSEKMLSLVMKLSQFNFDKDQIEHEWETITKELKDLQTKYDKSLNDNLKTLNVNASDFSANFTKENDAEKRYLYLTELRKKAAEKVAKDKEANPKEWKQQVFTPMNEVQSLKLRFGQITFRISQNILKYNDLFAKYRNDDQLGAKVKDLEVRLKELQETFDKAFDPLDYINSANKMYKVS